MVLLSLGSGLITALMTQAKPPRTWLDLDWIVDDAPVDDGHDRDHVVLPAEKTSFSQ